MTARARSLPRSVFTLGESETYDLGRSLGAKLVGGERILLMGELGMGKTVFTRGLAAGLGIRPEEVSSPSYTVIQEYPGGRLPLMHVDLYRIETMEDLETLGFEDVFETDGVVVVEWGDRLPEAFLRSSLTVRFSDLGEGSRRIDLYPIGSSPSVSQDDA